MSIIINRNNGRWERGSRNARKVSYVAFATPCRPFFLYHVPKKHL